MEEKSAGAIGECCKQEVADQPSAFTSAGIVMHSHPGTKRQRTVHIGSRRERGMCRQDLSNVIVGTVHIVILLPDDLVSCLFMVRQLGLRWRCGETYRSQYTI